jgi:hypothetical protein
MEILKIKSIIVMSANARVKANENSRGIFSAHNDRELNTSATKVFNTLFLPRGVTGLPQNYFVFLVLSMVFKAVTLLIYLNT